MYTSLLVVMALTVIDPEIEGNSSVTSENVQAYERAKAAAGRDAESHVRLALWCEAHGFQAEKLKHLALAVLLNPSHVTARGLLGLVSDRGKWLPPEAVSSRMMNDETAGRLLAEYNAKRAGLKDQSASAHWKLALWCVEKGLRAEAIAHFTAVTRLDPSRDEAWKRLGCQKRNGRWMSDAQIAAEKADAEAWKKAEMYWKPRLLKLRRDLESNDKSRRGAAEEALGLITDPFAVPSIWAVFVTGGGDKPSYHIKATRILGQINEAVASRALATLAVFDRSSEVRRLATETLRRRDARDFVTLLIGFLRNPIRFTVRQVGEGGGPGELFVEGERANMRRIYGLPPSLDGSTFLMNVPPRIFTSAVPFDPFSAQNLWLGLGAPGSNVALSPQASAALAAHPQNAPAILTHQIHANAHATLSPAAAMVSNLTALAAQQDMLVGMAVQNNQNIINFAMNNARQMLENDAQAVTALQTQVAQVNQATVSVLTSVTGQALGEAPEPWRKWWTDQQGYAYTRPSNTEFKPTLTEFVDDPVIATFHTACFGAGTPVRTLSGLRPIEELKVGDQVLAQDIKTGRLSFEPILTIFHNKPTATLRLKVGGETIVATGIHRFWKAGQGWVMARELKPGDRVRTVNGTALVESVENEMVQPVFNLEVASQGSYFVGSLGALVHDNTLVEPVIHAFDASGELVSASTNTRR